MLDLDSILPQLTLVEKISLLTGSDLWHTTPLERLQIPAVRMTDGPVGVRGTAFFAGIASNCYPCATGLAASFDRDLAQAFGVSMAAECKAKGAHVSLGPTINLHRSPLGGRGFECISEDPVLSGELAAGIIKGLQSNGVAACPKHYLCNEQEFEKHRNSSEVSQRALRELYLRAFQIAIRESDPWTLMTSYNKVNGLHVGEHPFLLKQILREEWGYDGMVVSDWFGTFSTAEALVSGMDLEMPGPSLFRGQALRRALIGGKIDESHIDVAVRRVLGLANRAIESGIPFEQEEGLIDTQEVQDFLRSTAQAAIVLLKNEASLLPLQPKKIRRLAVVGPNAKLQVLSGGGSASLRAIRSSSPLEGILAAAEKESIQVEYTPGVFAHRYLPLVNPLVRSARGGQGYLDLDFFETDPTRSSAEAQAIHSLSVDTATNFMCDNLPSHLPAQCYMRVSTTFVPDSSGVWEFGLVVGGQATLLLDDQLVVSNLMPQTAGELFLRNGSVEERGQIELEQGREYKMVMQWSNFHQTNPKASFKAFGCFRIGASPLIDLEEGIVKAIALAKDCDAVIVCAGLNEDYESEGFERPDMKLPGRTDELVERVLEANPNVCVVVQSGTPCEMPWSDRVPSIVQAFYGGNAGGLAIGDVLFGHANPSGKLPVSFAHRLSDNPSHPYYPGPHGKSHYYEDVFMGYRGFAMRNTPVLGCFGHGLSYTSFTIGEPRLIDQTIDVNARTIDIQIEVEVTNTGSEYAGSEVVQLYVKPTSTTKVPRPLRELADFQKIHLEPGATGKVRFALKRDAFSYWLSARETTGAWMVDTGRYELLFGVSSEDIKQRLAVDVDEGFVWNGL
ncbi:hypothetical protein FFLO_06074 [Filobasidium floriforme]|uniref:beta-glucosidase n=1 Tax=Filobasidium floriforme TaxID=5210 RepID=A0A8K0JFN5_9TREE|nr:glycoside hydrolase family 3 protein [Filobasidium floriforme]KAG7528588.1 hypothetical protein FFLO_06074 [Filobasidium floriforme]KAH8078669.1 glycoside hydrolase family 3 protein [Filobasidium floriforme]